MSLCVVFVSSNLGCTCSFLFAELNTCFPCAPKYPIFTIWTSVSGALSPSLRWIANSFGQESINCFSTIRSFRPSKERSVCDSSNQRDKYLSSRTINCSGLSSTSGFDALNYLVVISSRFHPMPDIGHITVGSECIAPCDSVHNLGVQFDSILILVLTNTIIN